MQISYCMSPVNVPIFLPILINGVCCRIEVAGWQWTNAAERDREKKLNLSRARKWDRQRLCMTTTTTAKLRKYLSNKFSDPIQQWHSQLRTHIACACNQWIYSGCSCGSLCICISSDSFFLCIHLFIVVVVSVDVAHHTFITPSVDYIEI